MFGMVLLGIWLPLLKIGLTSVSVTAPITDAGTAAEPNIGISDATNAAKGAVQLAIDPLLVVI